MADSAEIVRKCVLCSRTTSRLCNFTNNKVRLIKGQANLEYFLGFEDGKLDSCLDCLFVCDSAKCFNFLSDYCELRSRASDNVTEILNNAQREKRVLPTTPRVKVSDALAASVEKLKRLKLSETTEPSTPKLCRKRISYDHEYSSTSHEMEDECEDLATVVDSILTISFSEKTTEDIIELIDSQLTTISKKKGVLHNKSANDLSDKNLFNRTFIEFHSSCPFLLQVLLRAFKNDQKSSKIATIATVYGMIIHSRNNKMSAIQRLFSTVALKYNADNKLLTKLNKIHLTLTEHSKRTLIDAYGKESEEKLHRAISAGKDGKFNGDNLDIRVQTNEMRLDSKDRDLHFFATDFTFDRVNLNGLSNLKPDTENLNLSVECFVPTPNEYQQYTDSLKILLSREMLRCPGFSWMKSITPVHIPHEFQKIMSEKSDIHILPVSLDNEVSYQGCIHIMDGYEKYLNRWYKKAGRGAELDKLNVPVGGDQLTRVRLQGTKSLRAGAHTASERLDHLEPIIIEMFHTLQDFVEKLCKKFLDSGHGRDIGTIPNLKILLQRVNANGNVKSRYKAHEDFILTCGQAYFQSYVMSKFHMDTIDDTPVHPAIKDNIKNWTNENKQRIFDLVMDEVIADIFIPFDIHEPQTIVDVLIRDQKLVVTVPQTDVVKVSLIINGRPITVETNKDSIAKGVTLKVLGIDIYLKIQEESMSLKTYIQNFMQWFFAVIQTKDAIKEGDMQRTNIILKHMVPFFYSHSSLSKYFVECIDYVLKTEHTLSPYMAKKVRAGTFVNRKGKVGKNKAADLEKENQVKYLKTLIRSLGANKTENAIINITKAGPAILDICQNFDNLTECNDIQSTHKSRNKDKDIQAITHKLRTLKIWEQNPMKLNNVKIAKSPFMFNRCMFKQTVLSKVRLQLMNMPVLERGDSDEE